MLNIIATAVLGILAIVAATGVATFVLLYLEEIFSVVMAVVLIGVALWGITFGAYEAGVFVLGLFR